ncbi:MAG TPA: phosphoenolpyruvate--protein phosphotransferase, partial [Clostridiaceae bacterium]|nr:phosphoenolpyruvate--protein phosphotransferase [Clostridiaceae bacterium]HBG39272.1 phosphoenolpyruvate--protein phosphotransferase [Clostridiaceae bacterium]
MKGIKASPGIAIGKVYILVKKINAEKRTIEDVDKELKRLDNAMIKSSDQLQSIKEKLKNDGKEDTAKIFEAHNMILQDVEFVNQIKTQIKNEKVNSEYAVYSVTKTYEEMFNKIEDKYLRERAADVRDVGERIIFNLMGKVKDLSELPKGTIIVAEDLVPSDTATVDRTKVSAFVTETGGTTSHTAIISRIMEIPAVVGAKGITSKVKTGDTIIVDGS